jgi:hypothetical protein
LRLPRSLSRVVRRPRLRLQEEQVLFFVRYVSLFHSVLHLHHNVEE